ncbi:hypothetical protein C8F01DRAFT_1083622 [Mycena amicta]|nr:hypothetical protein C8F01DRAFT_1083622 [Mycena amicta]
MLCCHVTSLSFYSNLCPLALSVASEFPLNLWYQEDTSRRQLLQNNMMWFAETFDKSLARSQVEDALAQSIGDVVQAIWDNLTHPIRARLNYAQNPLEKVQILFGHLDSQSGNAVLVHAFRHALSKWGGIGYMLNNSLRGSTMQASSLTYRIDDIVFIRNCPPPSELFQGRKDILQQLDRLFQQTEQKEQKSVLLYGLGGAGKTQIALKFIADSGSRFTDQFKINASSAETIEAGYIQLAIDKKLGDTVEAARTWLKANQQEWLILFDNADKRDLNLGPYLPKYQHGNILITSRNPDLGIHTGLPRKAIQISDLAVDDASVLLLNRAGVELETGDNQKHAAMIAKVVLGVIEILSQSLTFFQELHCFPLAIVQAGAFIDKSPRLKQDISRYVQLYQRNKAKLLSEKPAQSTEDYNETVYTTWKMSFDQLSQVEPLAAQFLQLCSFIHFEGISEDIFERASTYDIEDGLLDPTLEVLESSFEFLSKFRDTDMTWNTLVFENITSELCGYSLMTWQNSALAYSIHPLVHQWSRTTITDLVGSQKLMVGLLGMAAACSPEVMQKIQLLLHIVRLSEDIDMIGTGFEPQLGSVFYAGGMYRRAETLQSHVVTKSDSCLGAEHPATIRARANLAVTYSSLGQNNDAQSLEEKVLEQQTRLLGAEHPATIRAMANLAATYYTLGQYTDAQTLEEKVLEQRTRLLGAEHPATILAMGNLARTYSSLGRDTDAQTLEEKVFEQRTRLLGAEHPDTILAMVNIASTYSSLGRDTDAQSLEEKVLEQQTRLLGAEHPHTILAMANLAATYSSLGRNNNAQSLEEKVLEQQTRLLGAEHPHTILAMANLAATYYTLGQYTDAHALEEKVLEQRTRLLGAEHPATILAMGNLARTYSSLGRDTDAQTLEEKVFEQRTRLLGAEHPDTILAMVNIASTYSSLGRDTDAQSLEEKVLEQQTRLLGAEHPATIRAMANLARTYSSLGRDTDAQTLEEKVLEQRTRLLGAEHPATIRAMGNIARTYSSLGRDTDAQTLEEKVLEQQTRLLGAEHPHTILAMANLAATYSSLGRNNNAQSLEEKVLEQRTRLLGAEHPHTILAMANLAATYYTLGQYTDAHALEEKVLEQRTRLLGAEHPDTIRTMANLAATYSSLGRNNDAQSLEDKVLEQQTRLLGAEHPATIQAMANLAATYYTLGQYTDAQTLEEKVLEQRTRLLGAEHPDTIGAMADLAATYSSLGRNNDAQSLEEKIYFSHCFPAQIQSTLARTYQVKSHQNPSSTQKPPQQGPLAGAHHDVILAVNTVRDPYRLGTTEMLVLYGTGRLSGGYGLRNPYQAPRSLRQKHSTNPYSTRILYGFRNTKPYRIDLLARGLRYGCHHAVAKDGRIPTAVPVYGKAYQLVTIQIIQPYQPDIGRLIQQLDLDATAVEPSHGSPSGFAGHRVTDVTMPTFFPPLRQCLAVHTPASLPKTIACCYIDPSPLLPRILTQKDVI